MALIDNKILTKNECQNKNNIGELKKIIIETLRSAPKFVVHYHDGYAPDSLHTSILCEEFSIAEYQFADLNLIDWG